MKLRKVLERFPFIIVIAAIAAVFCVITAFVNLKLAIIEAVFLAVICLYGFIYSTITFRKKRKILGSVVERFSKANSQVLYNFPLPIIVVDKQGRIAWYNDLFSVRILTDELMFDDNASTYLGGNSIEEIISLNSLSIELKNRYYTIFWEETENGNGYIFYYIDDTELKRTNIEYHKSKPVVMYVALDNFYELFVENGNTDSGVVQNEIEKIIKDWATEYNAVMQRMNGNRIFIYAERRYLEKIKEGRFGVLDKVRTLTHMKRPTGVTLSIGVGVSDSFAESVDNARNALDMAISRGGDQAAVKIKDTYEFYGGLTKGIEKRGKSKSRVTAGAISEIINGSDNVLVMGHRFSDLDCIGSAIGILSCAKAMKTKANILIDKKTTLASSLVERFEKEYSSDVFVTPEKAMITRKTLLVIVDTHRKNFTEYPQILDKVKTVIVIDHHRKAVDFLPNALMSYHDPNASSTCELVTELIQYMPIKVELSAVEAEALLSGIMLDTKNFILDTGVRTFEAAAYLKSFGADTVKVKTLFSNTLESNKQRNLIVSNAFVIGDCAVSLVKDKFDDLRVVCSQAADEMLNISNVNASFVLYKEGNTVNISARSLGKRNVQVMMEALGGGGHLTMAATQIPNSGIDDALKQLKAVIEKENK